MPKWAATKTPFYRNIYGAPIALELNANGGCLCVGLRHQPKTCSLKRASISLFVLASAYFVVNPVYIVIFLVVSLLLWLCKCYFTVKQETLLIVKGVGYQLSKKLVMWDATSIFIPYERVQRVFINEVIYRYKVIYVLSLLVQEGNQRKLVPLFQETLPRIDCLQTIFKSIKQFEHS